MKKLAFITLSSLLVSTAAFAHDQGALCDILSSKAAMSAAYQPGVDVNGKPVAPADVNAQPMPGMPDVIRIPVTIDMAKQLTANWPAGTEMKADMGMLELHKDGKVTLGGQDVSGATTTLCANTPKEETPAPAKQAAAKPHKASVHHAAAKQKKSMEAAEEKPAAMPAEAEAPAEKPAGKMAKHKVPPPAAMPSEKMDEPMKEDAKDDSKDDAPWSPHADAPAPAAGEPDAPPQERAAPPAVSPPAAPAAPDAKKPGGWDDEPNGSGAQTH